MKTFDTVGSVRDLVALARHIEQEEGISWSNAIHRAVALMPDLQRDIRGSVRFQPVEVHTSWSIPPHLLPKRN